MKKILYFVALFFIFTHIAYAQTNIYATCGSNKVINSDFETGTNFSTSITNWSLLPATGGWRQDNTLIYGRYLFVDALGTHTATPVVSPALCSNLPKVVKFYYNSANTGKYEFRVKLGNNVIATFSEVLLAAKSKYELGAGVEAHVIDRRFLSEGPISGTELWNNIWHEIILYVPNYTSGDLSFEYVRNGGISRQIRLDNVQVYEATPQPIITKPTLITLSCDASTADLRTAYTPKSGFAYEWHTVSLNPTTTTKLADATVAAASVGTYYLYMRPTSPCTGAGCLGPASQAVKVEKPAGCCGGELIKNGTFDKPTGSGGNTTFLPDWNMVTYEQFSPPWNGSSAVGSFIGGNTVLRLTADLTTSPYIEQVITCCPPGAILNFSMLQGMELVGGSSRTTSVSFGGTKLFNTSIKNDGFFYFEQINGSIIQDLKVNGNPVTPTTKIPKSTLASITGKIVYPKSATSSTPSLTYKFEGEGAVLYLDNISLSISSISPPNVTASSVNTVCPQGTANLMTLLPSNTEYSYEWHILNDINSALVPDPTKATPGIYYLFVRSKCSGCVSSSGTAVTVVQSCPTVSGKVFADYDGATNGITNGPGTSGGGLYALLVSGSTVLNSVKVNNDGTYSMTGTSGTSAYVMISNKNYAQGDAAPATSTLNPNYAHTGATPGNGTNGKTDNFTMTGSGTTTANFGIQFYPIAADALGVVCSASAYILPPLYGVDDAPTFNNGIGQKIIIKEILTADNGTLKYNNTPVTNNFTINAYEPLKLIFSRSSSEQIAKIKFTYVFVDVAGAESQERATVDYTFNVTPVVTDYSVKIVSGSSFTYQPENGVHGNVPAGTTYTWEAPSMPQGVSGGASSGGAQSSVSGTLTNTGQTSQTVTYTVTATATLNGAECSSSFTVTVIVGPKLNYWMGSDDADNGNKWALASNWTGAYIPSAGEDVVFATTANYGTPAKKDLHLDQDRVIGSLINASDKNLVVTSGNRLMINEKALQSGSGSILVKSSADAPSGTLLFAKPSENTQVAAQIELYSKALNCDCGQYPRKWQYIGIPVQSASSFPFASSNPATTGAINEWSEPAKGNKWITPAVPLNAFKGYELTNEQATMYRVSGALVTTDKQITLSKTSDVDYSGIHLIGNSYTAAIPISSEALQFSTDITDKTVYLFNTGTRDEWRKLDGSSINQSGYKSGQYLAVPIHLGGQANFPSSIPSMHAFMVITNGTSGTIDLKYDKLIKNATVNNGGGASIAWRSAAAKDSVADAPRKLPAMIIDVLSPVSADRMWLFLKEGTTRGFDSGWDAKKISEKAIVQLYSFISKEDKLQVSTVPNMEKIEIGFDADVDGNYTLDFWLSDEFENGEVYVMDVISGKKQRVTKNTSFSFDAKKGDSGVRFILMATGNFFVSDEEAAIKVEILSGGEIQIENKTAASCSAFIFDSNGKMLQQKEVNAKSVQKVEGLSSGVYLLRLQNATIHDVRRIEIK